MNRNEAALYADRAAAVIVAQGSAKSLSFAQIYKLRPDVLAQFVEQSAAAGAEGLFLFAARQRAAAGSTEEGRRAQWKNAAPATRVAFAVFRASYLALLELVKADEAAAAEAARAKAAGKGRFGQRTFAKRTHGIGDRVQLKRGR